MDGFFLIDKEQDWTSFDVVNKIRHVLREKKVGHAGTLDPMATGLLIVMVGKGTKQSDYIMGHSKEYIARIRLGTRTDTQDIWGTVLEQREVCGDLDEAISRFTGDIEQIPPMYSAIKIHGQKLYEIARRGGEVEREPRKIHVNSIERLDEDILKIRCSSGTYIRTLINDIGEYMGCGACMSELRRTKIGTIGVESAHKVAEITDGSFLLPLDTPFDDFI